MEGWKCFKMKDDSLYFGEIAYLTPEDEVVKEEDLSEESKANACLIRHGYGVQLFLRRDGEVLCKYEGGWHRDKKHGEGLCEYPNGDMYKGEFVSDKKQGKGTFKWKDGKEYIGEWKKDRMDGKGTFTHSSGLIHEGEFKADYFHMSDLMINPLYSEEELEIDISQQKEYRKFQNPQVEEKKKEVNLHRVEKMEFLHAYLERIENTGRVPLLISTYQSSISKSEVFEHIRLASGGIVEIDLKQMDLLKQENGREEVTRTMRELLVEATTKGLALVINLDDSVVEENYMPDLQNFYCSNAFPSYVLKPHSFKKAQQLWNAFADGEDIHMHPFFRVVMWSKMKVDEGLDDQDTLAKFVKSFSRALSLENVDCVICNNLIFEEEEEEEEEQEAEASIHTAEEDQEVHVEHIP